MDAKDLKDRFTHHPPTPAQTERHTILRARVLDLAQIIDGLVPDGNEKTLAVTHLEEAVMWANAAIARVDPAALGKVDPADHPELEKVPA